MMSTLTKRILTALVLITFVLLGIWLSTPFYFALITGLIVLAAAYEWAKLVKFSTKNGLLFLGLMTVLLLVKPLISDSFVLLTGCLFWIGAFFPVVRYKSTHAKPRWTKSSLTLMGIGMMLLYPFWVGLMAIFNIDRKLLLILLLIVAIEDSGAYFAGKRWGRHKLIAQVSPGKTWEGLMGGMILALAAIFFVLPCSLMGVSFLVIIFAVLGDLFESLIKRIYQVKDSGTLLPGHGGLLDRIDSLTAAVPFFALGCLWLLL